MVTNASLCTFGVLGAVLIAVVSADDSQALRVPAGYAAKEGTKAEPYSSSGYASEILHGETQVEMVFIPAGEFDMGSQATRFGRSVQ